MSTVSVSPEYKKLYARTLKLGIERYLILNRCSNMLIEHGADELFGNCLTRAIQASGVGIISPSYTGYHREAFGLFISVGYQQDPLLETFIALMADFRAWKIDQGEPSPDFSAVVEALTELGASEHELTPLLAAPVGSLTGGVGRTPDRESGDGMLQKAKERRVRIFIGSSKEGLRFAEGIQANLHHDYECTIWNQGVFDLSSSTIETLERQLSLQDFAVLVVTPDDTIESRGSTSASPRDNVIFEFGLFMGALGRNRTFIVRPRRASIKMPSDLLGITTAEYDDERSDNNAQAATGPACTAVKGAIAARGPKVP